MSNVLIPLVTSHGSTYPEPGLEPEVRPEPEVGPETKVEPELEAGCSFWEAEQESESLKDIHSRLRQRICPPKRLTYDTLGENSVELLPTTQCPSQALASFTESLVKDDLDPPSDTTGWATNLLFACQKINVTSPVDVYNLLSEDP